MKLFEKTGVHCVVDGQFGSTGKGALSAWLAQQAYDTLHSPFFDGAIYSGGPNSGHTCYFKDKKIVLKQLPTFSVYMAMLDVPIPVYLSAGAVIDRDILWKEADEYSNIPIFVHPNAAIVTDEDKREEETGSIAEVAGTRSGTGAALARKIRREIGAVAEYSLGKLARNISLQRHRLKPEQKAYFMEISQGFSLGINSQFYPKVTSRECTVMQGLADARIPPGRLARTYMAIRTYPIRVGNVDGFSSGEWYPDQQEVGWEELSLPPEYTTVTNRVRRVATFSTDQFFEACYANNPDVVFISHIDYLDNYPDLIGNLKLAREAMGMNFKFLLGSGPRVEDIKWEKE